MTLFQAKIALTGLKLQARTGLKMSSKVNTYRLVAAALGYSPKQRPSLQQLIEELEVAIADTEARAEDPQYYVERQ